jgi:MEMO1 family protein
MVGHLTDSKQEYYARVLSETVSDPRTLLVISSDFCHWGDHFDYFYLRDQLDASANNVSKQIERLDREGIEHIRRMDVEGFRGYLDKTQNTICGCQPIILGMEIMNRIGKYEGILI